MLQVKQSLNLIEQNYNFEKNILAKTVFSPNIINSVCSLEKGYKELDGNDFYIIINSRQNTNCMVFQKRAEGYYKSSLFDPDWLSIREKIEELKPVKVVIEISNSYAQYYLQKAQIQYPTIQFIPVRIDEQIKKIMIEKLINLFENRKIYLPTIDKIFLTSFLENEQGYIPCRYEEQILTMALLTAIEDGI
jgi:hypothetical protein